MPLKTFRTKFSDDQAQRVRFSVVLVKCVTPIAIVWFIVGFLLDAQVVMGAAIFALVGFVASISLHHYEWHLTARVLWLVTADLAVAVGAAATPPEGHLSFVLVALAVSPVVLFSKQTNGRLQLFLIIAPIVLWTLVWWHNAPLFGEYEIPYDTAHTVLAPLAAVTVFGTVLFVVSYFVLQTHIHAAWLVEAQRQAEQSSKAKSALMRSVSHEMLTPLHAVHGYAELLHSDAKSRRAINHAMLEQHTGQIMNSSMSLRLIVENIFDFANWNADDPSFETKRVSVRDCLETALAQFSQTIVRKDLKFDARIDGDLHVQANAEWLSAIFKHVLDNAIKFSPPGGDISVHADLKDSDMVEIVIKDSGPGFPPGSAEKAFIAFERLGQETGTTPGVGIGLSLAQNFARAMGGQIVIDDAVQKGALVRMLFPGITSS
jgi:signal transduction histidine kinase